MDAPPSVAVVVPTRDRPDSLARCLAALAQQTVAAEIVVVDDASTDGAAVARVVETCSGSRLVRGEGRGPAAARNLGARAARGDVIAFTDDDCVPAPDWLERLVARHRGAEVVAGRTISRASASPPVRAAQTITNHLVEESVTADGLEVGFAPTCNLAVRQHLLRALPFDEGYPLAAGEDRDWCARLAAAGIRLAYEPAAVVVHAPTMGWRGFWRQQVRYGHGAHRFRAGGVPERSRPRARFYVALLRKGFRQGFAVGVLVVVAQLATAIGMARSAISGRGRGAAPRR